MAFVLLVSGCLGADDPTAATGPGADAAGVPDAFTFRGCAGLEYVAVTPASAVTPWLPPGYAVANAVSGPHLKAVMCEAVEVGDQVYTGIGFAEAGVNLAAANGAESPGSADFYVFELVFDVEAAPALATLLVAAGWPVLDGEVTVGPTSLRVAAEGLEYEGTVAGTPMTDAILGEAFRWHHASMSPVFLDYDGNDPAQATAWPSTLAASGGAWGDFGQGLGRTGGVSQNALLDGAFLLGAPA